MNYLEYVSGDGKVRIVRTQLNCEVRTRFSTGSDGQLNENITLRCQPIELELVERNTERVHEHARKRIIAGNK